MSGSISVRAAASAAGTSSLRGLRSALGEQRGSARELAQIALLHKRYLDHGGALGPLGWPMTATTITADRSAARLYEGGEVRLTSGGTDLIVSGKTWSVTFVGLECMRESSHDQSSPSDEPYVMWFVQSGSRVSSTQRHDFSNIDTGSKIAANQTIASQDNQFGIPFVISVVMFEHDRGDREQARKAVNQAIADFVKGVNEIIDQVNNYQQKQTPNLPAPVNMPVIESVLAFALGLRDDQIGGSFIEVFMPVPGETTIEQVDARIQPPPIIGTFEERQYTHVTEVRGGSEGRYRLYFRVGTANNAGNTP
jgi:hypothetical protein